MAGEFMIEYIILGIIICLIIAYLLGKWLVRINHESKMVSERLKKLVEKS